MAPAAAPPPATSSRVSAEPPQLGLNLLPHGAGESTKALRLVGLDPTLANAVDGGSALPTARPSSRRNDSWTTGKRPSADALADALLDWSPASSTAGSSSGDLLLQQRPARTSSSSAAAINGPSRANARGDNREGKLTALLGLPASPSTSPGPSPTSSRKSSTTALGPSNLASLADNRLLGDPAGPLSPPPQQLPSSASASSSAAGSLAQRKHHSRRTSLSIGGLSLGFGSLSSSSSNSHSGNGSASKHPAEGERSAGSSPSTTTTAGSGWSKRSFSSGRGKGATSAQTPTVLSPTSDRGHQPSSPAVDSPSSAAGRGGSTFTPRSTSGSSAAQTPVASSPLLSPTYAFQPAGGGRPALTSSHSTGSFGPSSTGTGWQSQPQASAAASRVAGPSNSGHFGRTAAASSPSSTGGPPPAAGGQRQSSGHRRGSASDRSGPEPPAAQRPSAGPGLTKSAGSGSVTAEVKPSGGSMRDLVGFLRWGSGGGKDKGRAREGDEVERLAEEDEGDASRQAAAFEPSIGPLPRFQPRSAITGGDKTNRGLARSRSTSAAGAGPPSDRSSRPLPSAAAPAPAPNAARRFLNLGRSTAPSVQAKVPDATLVATPMPVRAPPVPTYIYADEGFDDAPSVLYPRPAGGLSQAELSLAHALWVARTLSPHPPAEALAAGRPDHRLFYLPPGGKEGTVREARERFEADRRGADWSAERKAAWWFETGERLAGWDFDAVLRERAQAAAVAGVTSGTGRRRTRTARQGYRPERAQPPPPPQPGEAAALSAKSSMASLAPSLTATMAASFTTSLLTTPTGQTLALALDEPGDFSSPPNADDGRLTGFSPGGYTPGKPPTAPLDEALPARRPARPRTAPVVGPPGTGQAVGLRALDGGRF